MYEKFYGFSEKPFNMTPDTKFFYPSPKHEEAQNCIIFAISQKSGFVVITGEIGSGKTTVCRTLVNKLDITTKVAMIFNTYLGRKDLLTAILEDLGIEYKSTSKTHLLSALNKYLVKQAEDGIDVILIIDEAQNLTSSVIEEIRMLSNFETETEKLIQIVLVGQPELRQKLLLPKLEQFRQRVLLQYHIEPLSYAETRGYIKYRLLKVGSPYGEIFTREAIDEIYKYSKGVPRLINLVCNHALINGVVYDKRKIDVEIAREAVRELLRNTGMDSLNIKQDIIVSPQPTAHSPQFVQET